MKMMSLRSFAFKSRLEPEANPSPEFWLLYSEFFGSLFLTEPNIWGLAKRTPLFSTGNAFYCFLASWISSMVGMTSSPGMVMISSAIKKSYPSFFLVTPINIGSMAW